MKPLSVKPLSVKPWKLSELLADEATAPAGSQALLIEGLSIDSRTVKPGYLFAALPGLNCDGARYIEASVRSGAVAIIGFPKDFTTDVPFIAVDNPRRLLAHLAHRFYNAAPETIVAVTGTNGKTSVSVFTRQIWEILGYRAASLGTIGVVGPSGSQYLKNTTPDAIDMARILAELSADNITHLALEASSHGLAQYRLDGVSLKACAFTNFTQDHLDYHADLNDYFMAKMRLFTLLPKGAPAVINADLVQSAELIAYARRSGLQLFDFGRQGQHLTLLASQRDGFSQLLTLKTKKNNYQIRLPLAGAFQASNALAAAGLVISLGGDEEKTIAALAQLQGVCGRLDLVGRTKQGAPIFVDYAHTPDALEKALLTLRPYVSGMLSLVFGCGGDRDKSKRPIMGEIAARLADRVVITDDNPRTEEGEKIRREIQAGMPKARNIADRGDAIHYAIEELREGDILLIAGKGHEEGQIIGTITYPFSDHAAVKAVLERQEYHG